MATKLAVHDAKILAARDLFHVRERPCFYQNQCKTQNLFFFHFYILLFSGKFTFPTSAVVSLHVSQM